MKNFIVAAALSCFCIQNVYGNVSTNPCTLTDPVAVDRDGEVTLQQLLNNDERTLTIKVTYTGGRSWIGVGINEEGKAQMTPSTVVIGWGSEDEDAPPVSIPITYAMSTKELDGSGVLPTASQTLQNATFEQTETTSILTFTQSIDDFGSGNPVSDASQWIFAIGSPNNGLGHPIFGSFRLTLASKCISADDEQLNAGASGGGGVVVDIIVHPERGLWIAHGIFMGIAWGFFAPLAIGASVLRDGFDRLNLPKGTWFKVHFYFNVMTVLMTIAGFFMAIAATSKEDGAVHASGTHHKIGFAIFVVIVIQAFGGIFRPDLPKATPIKETQATTNNKEEGEQNETTEKSTTENHDDTENPRVATTNNTSSGSIEEEKKLNAAASLQKSATRIAWERTHRIFGCGLFILALINCHTGIDWFVFNFDDEVSAGDDNSWYHSLFWGVSGGLMGLMALFHVSVPFL